MQTDFATNVGARHGLERGIKGSRAKHERVKRHYGLVNQAHDQAAELGMFDRASLSIGKPTKKALEAVEAGDSYITIAKEFQAQRKAIKAREKNLFEQVHELRNMKARVEQEKAEAALAQKQVQELRRELEAERRKAAKADELLAARTRATACSLSNRACAGLPL
jgi:DNA repair ATPase RecN